MGSPEWLNKAIDLYVNQKLTFKEIGHIVSASRKTVAKYINAAGYQSNPKFVRHINPNKLRKYDYSYCDHVFDKIDTEEKAYWLGFLYADGNVSRFNTTIELALEENDKEHIEKFRSFVHLENKPLSKKQRILNGQKYYSYRFSFNSANVKQSLINLGCKPQKTFDLSFPNNTQVPENLLHHFIRGYIDGDGCIYVSNKKISVEVLGTENFLLGYKQWVGLGQSKIYTFNHSDIYRVVNSNQQALNILKRIYKDATLYLERKHIKYINYLAVRQKDCKDLSEHKRAKSVEAKCDAYANTEVTE